MEDRGVNRYELVVKFGGGTILKVGKNLFKVKEDLALMISRVFNTLYIYTDDDADNFLIILEIGETTRAELYSWLVGAYTEFDFMELYKPREEQIVTVTDIGQALGKYLKEE